MTAPSFSHLSSSGEVRMVSVGEKPETDRVATARAVVLMAPTTLKMVRRDQMAKGNVLTTAQIAGMNAAKHTGTLIPMCHPIALTHVELVFEFSHKPSSIIITATAAAHAKTGVEMEAMTAASVAALTIYDMCKSVERGIVVSEVELIHKSGGKSGVWDRYRK